MLAGLWEGIQKIASQQVEIKQEGDLLQIATITRGLPAGEGGYHRGGGQPMVAIMAAARAMTRRFSGASMASPDNASRGRIGNLAAETNARYRPAWPGVCRCWLPFGSPFGSPESLTLRRSRRQQPAGHGRMGAGHDNDPRLT